MNSKTIPLSAGKFYHIYNHAVGKLDLFHHKDDYEHFLKLYDKYISPVADTFAWVLMKNHFHFLVRIKEDIMYKYNAKDSVNTKIDFNELKWETTQIPPNQNQLACTAPNCVDNSKQKSFSNNQMPLNKIPKPNMHFSHLFNAYTKHLHKKNNSFGILFDRPFKRKQIDDELYLKQVLTYIHNNPVHHGFCNSPIEYPWSSYSSILSVKSTKLKRDHVIGWFDSQANFLSSHNQDINTFALEQWLDLI